MRSCQPSRNRLSAIPPFAFALLVQAAFSSVAQAQTLEGFTEPAETIQVASPESGIIDSIDVKQGDYLALGHEICSLDNAVLLVGLEAARARAGSCGKLEAAEATAKLRQQRLHSLRSLRAKGHASPEEVERAQADADVASANLLAAHEETKLNQLEVKRIESQIQRRTICSPIDGVVVRIHKKPGEFVAATDAIIATVVQLSTLRVRFYLPTSRALRLSTDQSVSVHMPETNQKANAYIDFISPVTDSDSGTVRVEVMVDNATDQYRSGLRCVLLDE